MSQYKSPPYILQELPDITENINYPIKNVQRIKYTCMDVSQSLIAFGATSGGIYVFNRNPCDFVQLIPNKDGAITRLAISLDEKHIGFANGRGLVTVTACNQSLSGGHSTVASKEHQGNEVTAMAWSPNNMLFTGDDVGKISVLQLQSFIAKTMFQSSSLTIMSLDSRICQIDIKSCMLLISTLTRCYICDTSQEQYRQIGQKLRDGEYGACFVNNERIEQQNIPKTTQDITEVKKYNIVNEDSGFAVGKDLENTLIFCARPSSRLWEATVDGSVVRTHQYKQVLGKGPMKIVTLSSYENEEIFLADDNVSDNEGQSVNFPKIYLTNGAIFSFKRDALYFLNTHDVDHTIWFDAYKDIVDCKVYHEMVYIWLSNGTLVNLRYLKIDKFLLKCYVDEKFVLCAKVCAWFREYFLSSDLSGKLHILVGLRDRIEDKELLETITDVLDKFEGLKSHDATQMKSGIYVVDNSYNTQTALLDDMNSKQSDEYKFGALSPEAIQTLKELSVSVSDKLNTSKKMLKEKWVDFEGKMKHLSIEKHPDIKEIPSIGRHSTELDMKRIPTEESAEDIPIVLDNDIIYKESSQKAIEVDNNSLEKDKICKSLYQYFKLRLVNKETEGTNLISIIDSYACDMNQIYSFMLLLERYCLNIGAFDESKFLPNNIFLTYLHESTKRDELLDCVVKDEVLYKYFVDSCISVNINSQQLSNIGCDCGFPLPYTRTNQTPVFTELIDIFIEKQWTSRSRNQCYDICKRMPYLWRKTLYLRRNEDLLNILRILLQMLDERLLHSFLPQFTLDTWERAVQLYATLHANICLNCSKRFDHISVRETLSWDDLGALMIKSIGGRNAIKVMERHAALIDAGAITVKFYHTCFMVTMYERYDATIIAQLTDALYSSYDFEDSKLEICKLLRSTVNGRVKNTALPLIVAAKSPHWGLTINNKPSKSIDKTTDTLADILDNLSTINNGIIDCVLCGLPLQNVVLIKDGGLWVFKCGHTFHGACLDLSEIKLCPLCTPVK